MTTDIIELSKQAAEVLGVTAWDYISDNAAYNDDKTWLAQDSGRCAEIANSKMLDTINFKDAVVVDYRHAVYLSDHQEDRNAAWRVAVLKAVLEQGIKKDSK